MSGSTCRTSCTAKYVHSFDSYSCKSNFATLTEAFSCLSHLNKKLPLYCGVVLEFSQNFDPAMTVVKDATESVAKLSGKNKKTRLTVRDHGQEEGKVSDKSTISPARNITREHVWIFSWTIKERRVWNRYFDCGLTLDAISEFLMWLCAFLTPFTSILRLLGLVLRRIYWKSYRKSIYQPFFIYRSSYCYWFNLSLNYRRFWGIIGNIIVIENLRKIIEKLSLSKNFTYHPPLLTAKLK